MGSRAKLWGLVMALACAGCDELPPEEDDARIDGANVNAFGNRHGYVEVQLLDGIGAPLEGTRQIKVVLDYGPCFAAFYQRSSSWTPEGVSGRPVFEAATLDLCAPDGSVLAQCSVLAIEQQVSSNSKLLVDYGIDDLLDGQRLRIGPLPTRGLAECPDDAPVFAGQLTAFGLAADEGLLWRATASGIPAWQDASRELVVRKP